MLSSATKPPSQKPLFTSSCLCWFNPFPPDDAKSSSDIFFLRASWEEYSMVNQSMDFRGFPGGSVVKNPPANAGDTGSSPGPGRFRMLRNN